MDGPIDKPKDGDGAPQSLVSSFDSSIKKIREFLAAKVLSLSIFVVGLLVWAFQSYGLPATQSIWKEMLLPRIHNFIVEEAKTPEFHDLMVKTINNYLSGDLPTTEKPNDAGIRLRKLAQGSDRIDAISTSLFGGVDSVYTISNEYNLEQLKDITKNVLTIQTEPSIDPIRLFIYADPKQHCVWAYVKASGYLQRARRKDYFFFDLQLNDAKLQADKPQFEFNSDVTKFIQKRQGTGGGGREENEVDNSKTYLTNIQKIEISPVFPNLDPIPISGLAASIPEKQQIVLKLEGYILVTRRPQSGKIGDCKSSITASALNGTE